MDDVELLKSLTTPELVMRLTVSSSTTAIERLLLERLRELMHLHHLSRQPSSPSKYK